MRERERGFYKKHEIYYVNDEREEYFRGKYYRLIICYYDKWLS